MQIDAEILFSIIYLFIRASFEMGFLRSGAQLLIWTSLMEIQDT